MRLLIAAVLAAASVHATSICAVLAADRALQMDRLDAVRLGMTMAEAERGLGASLKPTEGERNDSCWHGIRTDGVDPGIAYMIEAGRVTRIDLFDPLKAPAPTVATASGISLGATVEELRRRHPTVQFEPHPIAPHSQWAVVERNAQGGIRVQVLDGRVVAIWSAQNRALDYPEGCS